MEPLIDLIAVAYQAPSETKAFLASVADWVGTPFTLTIWENSSPDLSVADICLDGLEHIQETNHNMVSGRVVLNPTNVGYARAVNAGLKDGTAPFIGVLNCDTRFLSHTNILHHLVMRLRTAPQVAVIGPRTTDSEGRLTHAGIVPVDGRDTHRYWLQPDGPYARDILSVPTVSGATYFTRRNVWDELTNCAKYRVVAPDAEGAFLPTKHFYEETFHAIHCRAHGYDVQYHGDLHMIHEWHRSSPRGSQDMATAEAQYRAACAAHDIELTF